MIPVAEQQEPSSFDDQVRKPGHRFLTPKPDPKGKEWNGHEYWRREIHALHSLYRGICSYSCHWIPHDTGFPSIDHYKPKDLFPSEAYEWSNYRLMCGTLNGRKGVYEDVLDPFSIGENWFTISFPSLIVKPADGLDADLVIKITATIARLGLNDESTCLKSRYAWTMDYCNSKFTFQYLREKAPFIARELERQDLVANIIRVMLP